MGFDNKDEALGILREFVNNQVPSRITAEARDIAEFAVEKATELSPFDTGRFMASWRVSLTQDVGEPAAPGRRSDEYEAATEAVNASRAAVAQISFGKPFYLGNNVPYGVYVEYGGPTAPAHYITQRVAQSIGAVYGKISDKSSVRHRFSWGSSEE